MKKCIQLEGKNVIYIIRKSARTKRIRLILHPDGSLVVSAPRRVSERIIEEIISEKTSWILTHLEYFKKHEGRLYIKNSRKDYLKYKEQARALANRRLKYFGALYGFRYAGISIRNQKTRWGSCSRKGNLNFNYKIALLPEKFADYIIVHELCHTKEFNHSRRFWDLVAQTIPDYKYIRKELKI